MEAILIAMVHSDLKVINRHILNPLRINLYFISCEKGNFFTYLDLRGSLIRRSLENKFCIYFVARFFFLI
jgi:hypothetical protein